MGKKIEARQCTRLRRCFMWCSFCSGRRPHSPFGELWTGVGTGMSFPCCPLSQLRLSHSCCVLPSELLHLGWWMCCWYATQHSCLFLLLLSTMYVLLGRQQTSLTVIAHSVVFCRPPMFIFAAWRWRRGAGQNRYSNRSFLYSVYSLVHLEERCNFAMKVWDAALKSGDFSSYIWLYISQKRVK